MTSSGSRCTTSVGCVMLLLSVCCSCGAPLGPDCLVAVWAGFQQQHPRWLAYVVRWGDVHLSISPLDHRSQTCWVLSFLYIQQQVGMQRHQQGGQETATQVPPCPLRCPLLAGAPCRRMLRGGSCGGDLAAVRSHAGCWLRASRWCTVHALCCSCIPEVVNLKLVAGDRHHERAYSSCCMRNGSVGPGRVYMSGV
jgi:hypothetical protein